MLSLKQLHNDDVHCYKSLHWTIVQHPSLRLSTLLSPLVLHISGVVVVVLQGTVWRCNDCQGTVVRCNNCVCASALCQYEIKTLLRVHTALRTLQCYIRYMSSGGKNSLKPRPGQVILCSGMLANVTPPVHVFVLSLQCSSRQQSGTVFSAIVMSHQALNWDIDEVGIISSKEVR